MPKIILSTLLVLLACSGLLMANECQIKEVTQREVNNNFTFKTIIQKGLFIYAPQPTEAMLSYDGVTYIYDKDNLISLMTVQEKFQKSETIEKTIQESYLYNCSEPIIKINKPDFDIFIIKGNLNDKPRAIAFILNKKDDSHFYLLSFSGFSTDQATQMLIRN